MSESTALRKLGWRRDPDDAEYENHGALLARVRSAARLPLLPAADHRQFRGAPIYQGGVGACFCFDLVRRFQLWSRMHDQPDGLVSPRALYWAVRAQEYAGDDPEDVAAKLSDTGSIPSIGYRAVSRVGFVRWEDCPYPTGDAEWNASEIRRVVTEPPPPAMWARAFAQRGLETARVRGTGLDRARSVAELLQNRLPVGFGMEVDLAFMRNRGQVVGSINSGTVQGGHAMTVLAIVGPDGFTGVRDPSEVGPGCAVVVDNWWEDWGAPDGTGRLSVELFCSDWISDVTSVQFVPAVVEGASA